MSPDKKISTKTATFFLGLGLVQALLVVEPIAFYLIRRLSVAKELIIFAEILSVPVTVFILSLFVMQRLKWQWVNLKIFAAGFWIMVALFTLGAVQDVLLPHNEFLTAILRSFTWLNIIIWPLAEISKYLIALIGWKGWDHLLINLYFTAFVIMPLLTGFLFATCYLTAKLIREKIIRLKHCDKDESDLK